MSLPADFRFSASGVSLGMRCEAAWAYCYLDGLRRPEVLWRDVTAATAPRDRSTALGTEVHAAFETWYAGGEYDWSSFPGIVAISGQHLVPHPDRLEWAESEGKMPPLEFGGIVWNGRMDLLVCAPSEFKRMGIKPPGDVLLSDFKTSSNIGRYALTPPKLAVDLQSNLYGLAVMSRESMARLAARWAYVETKKVRRAYASDVILERPRACDIVGAAADVAKHLAAIPDSASATKNPAACGDYGGCEYHHSNGGPCHVQRSVGALIQARWKKPTITTEGIPIMAEAKLPQDTLDRLAKFKNKGATPAADAPAEKPKAAPKAAANSTPAPAPAEAPRGRGRPPGAKNKAKDTPAEAAPEAPATRDGSRTQQLVALAADLAAAEEAELEAAATREAIEAAIRELMAG